MSLDITEKMTPDQIAIYSRFSNTFPFPIVEFANELGLEVYAVDLPSHISGKIEKKNDKYIIQLNQNNSPKRLRFTLAHELGHFFNDKDYLDSGREITDQSKQLYHAEGIVLDADIRKRDVKANQFAAEILMPEEVFIKKWKESKTPEEVASLFNVSLDAVKYRSANLLGEIY